MYDAYASEMQQTTQDEDYLLKHAQSLGSRPIRVLTSGNHGIPAGEPDRVKYQKEVTRAQARWLALSSNSKQIFAHSQSEYIQLDDPQTVISAIREVYDQEKQPTETPRPLPRVVELKASDGAMLKAQQSCRSANLVRESCYCIKATGHGSLGMNRLSNWRRRGSAP